MDRQFAMSGRLIDSFDSSDPSKSTATRYDLAKRQSNGDVGVEPDTGGNSDLSSQYVYGDVAYSGPAMPAPTNVRETLPRRSMTPSNGWPKPWTSVNPEPQHHHNHDDLTGAAQKKELRHDSKYPPSI